MKTIPDFTQIDFAAPPATATYADWSRRVTMETGKNRV